MSFPGLKQLRLALLGSLAFVCLGFTQATSAGAPSIQLELHPLEPGAQRLAVQSVASRQPRQRPETGPKKSLTPKRRNNTSKKPDYALAPRRAYVIERCERGRVVIADPSRVDDAPLSLPKRILPGACEEGSSLKLQILRGRRRGKADGVSKRSWMYVEGWREDGVWCRMGEKSERLPFALFKSPLDRDEPITLLVRSVRPLESPGLESARAPGKVQTTR